MRRDTHRQHGYSLSEMLTIVAIVGLVAMAAIPAIFQLYPQHRLRSTAGDLGSEIRMARQKAIGTRSPWRVAFDLDRNRYTVLRLRGPNASYRSFPMNSPDSKLSAIANSTWWVPVDRRGMDSGLIMWRQLKPVDLRASSVSTFFNTDCSGAAQLSGPDLVFLGNGAVARNGDCGAPGTDLDFVGGSNIEELPEVVLAISNRLVATNRIRLQVRPTGQLVTVSEKQ